MTESFYTIIAQELKITDQQVRAVQGLLDEGATVPFIARYRKELTNNLDEVAILGVRDRWEQLQELKARKEAIIKSLKERNLLTDSLDVSIDKAQTITHLEDIYAPYKPKRKTRASVAKEKGLEPLAKAIFEDQDGDASTQCSSYLDDEKGVLSEAEALTGAKDIIAEWISEDASARSAIRDLFEKTAILHSKVIPGKEEEGQKFKDYYDWSEPLCKAPSHRILAMRRGEKEGFLFFRIHVDEDKALNILRCLFIKGKGQNAQYVDQGLVDGFKRLLGPSLETQARMSSKKEADIKAIEVFAKNLKELLMASPLGQKRVLAIDPGFRTGCKMTYLGSQGELLDNDVFYLHEIETSRRKVPLGIAKYGVEAIAIGNGTASRETEQFIRELKLPSDIPVVIVNESGASIYSASEVAREEFPNHDITVRGAVSIGRRLIDPLAELVKLDPKSIGVGQYQHDVDQTLIKKSLDDVVISCVNQVGVEVNTASKQLLSYVSGLNLTIADNIVSYRNEHGPFRTREALKQVPRLGPKAFEQCAGFLRIRQGECPLDASAVHPERYPLIEQMARDVGCDVQTLIKDEGKRRSIAIERYASESVGLLTLADILAELAKPGRDPRKQFEFVRFNEQVHTMDDLVIGMELPGVVTNVAAFGAFVDIGVHQDGLVHISQLADTFVENPAVIVKVGQAVKVIVVDLDLSRKRIALSMRQNPELGSAKSSSQGQVSPKQKKDAPKRPKKGENLQANWFDTALGKL